MPKYIISANVAIPEVNSNRNTDRVQTILAMELGDSVFIENKFTAASYARAMKEKAGFYSLTRPVETDDEVGFRVWRVAPPVAVAVAVAK